MRKLIPLILLALIISCTTMHEFHLKSNGDLYSKGKLISDEELKNNYIMDEILLYVDYDVPYEKITELMAKLKEGGVKKVELKIGLDERYNLNK